MPVTMSDDVLPNSAEVASTHSALGALVAVGGATRALSSRRVPPPSPRSPGFGVLGTSHGSRSDTVELEDSAASFTNASKHQVDQSDIVLRASVTRLDSRMRALEGQGVRADRRAGELAGLAQALTEEQRALLIRLDRIEEQLRSMRQPDTLASSDDVLRRLARLEREHRAAALNLRLIVSVTEEAQQRHIQRLRSFEDLVDSRFCPIEERLDLCAHRHIDDWKTPPRPGGLSSFLDASASPEAESQARRFGSSFTGGGSGSLTARRGEGAPIVAAVAASLGFREPITAEASGLFSRLRGQPQDDLPAGTAVAMDSVQLQEVMMGEVRELRAHVDALATSRPEALEVQVQRLSDALEELRGHVDVLPSSKNATRHASSTLAEDTEMSEKLNKLEERSEVLFAQSVGIAGCATELSVLSREVTRLSQQVQQQAVAVQNLTEKVTLVDKLTPDIAVEQVLAQARDHADVQHNVDECLVRPALLEDLENMQAWLGKELDELRGIVHSTIEDKLEVAVLQFGRQVPDALVKVDQLLTEQTGQFAKLEEHDVRLGMALNRLGTQEQKMQSCMDRVEMLPMPAQVRGMLREELQRRLGVADVCDMARTINLQSKALEELQARFEDVCDQLVHGGMVSSRSFFYDSSKQSLHSDDIHGANPDLGAC